MSHYARRHSTVSPAKVDEPIEIPFGFWTRVGPRNRMLDRSPEFPMKMGNFEEEKAALNYRDSVVSVQKRLNRT